MHRNIASLVLLALLVTACGNENPFSDREPGSVDVIEIERIAGDGLQSLTTASSIAEQEDFPESLRGPRDVEADVLIVWCDPADFTLSDSFSNGSELFLTLQPEAGEAKCVLWAVPRIQLAGVQSVIVQNPDQQTLEVSSIFP